MALKDYNDAPKNDSEGVCYESFVGHFPEKKVSDNEDVYSQIIGTLKSKS